MTGISESQQSSLDEGRCPFCGSSPQVTWAPDMGGQWGAENRFDLTGCEHLVVVGGVETTPKRVLTNARSWNGPGWPWQGGWPAEFFAGIAAARKKGW